MKLTLVRVARRDTYTISKLSINGIFECDILEDKDRDLNHDGDLKDPGEEKVFGQTAIPCGTYQIDITYSERFKRMLPLLENVPGFSGIRIHTGNTAVDTHGCLLVGKNTEIGKVTDSKKTFDKLFAKLAVAHEAKETIFITIS
jgi:hypothetical protein